jgi:hypothetical protein
MSGHPGAIGRTNAGLPCSTTAMRVVYWRRTSFGETGSVGLTLPDEKSLTHDQTTPLKMGLGWLLN